METLSKIWYFNQPVKSKQREVGLLIEHRIRYGLSGNCFDLALWLLDEFSKNKIHAYPVANDLFTTDAHVAVVVLDEDGFRYLCDLGDQWIQPILIDSIHPSYSEDAFSNFFPAAKVQVKRMEKRLRVYYHRSNGKFSTQNYDLTPISMEVFLKGAEFSQQHISRKPLFEKRIPYKEETAHWEFYNWKSFLSTSEGLMNEKKRNNTKEWAEVIARIANADINFIDQALEMYKRSY
ncbi:hypothetical protein [Saliterribacillus persicus]|nr:hypothetical protein [Saliterribacillus persicus]